MKSVEPWDKNPRIKAKTQQQTQLTYVINPGIQIQAKLTSWRGVCNPSCSRLEGDHKNARWLFWLIVNVPCDISI